MASGTWTSVATSGAWNTTSNWSGAVVANASGFTANFTSNITATTTIDTTTGANWSGTIGSIVFSDAGAAGSAWALGSQATITLAGGTPTITTTTAATVNGVLAGAAGIVKAGASSLTTTAVNTYSGGTTINAGTWIAAASSPFSTSTMGTGVITIANGATLQANNAHLFGWNVGTFNNITVNSGGTFNLQADNYIGNLTMNGNAVVTGSANFLALATGILSYTGSTASDQGTIAKEFRPQSPLGGQDCTATITGTNSNGDLVISGAFNGSGKLTKAGAGILVMSGASGINNNGVVISVGTVRVAATAALGTGTITINNASTGSNATTLQINATSGSVTLNNALTVANQGSGTVTVGSATTSGTNLAVFSGAVTLNKNTIFDGGSAGDRLGFTGGISGTANVTIAGTKRVMFYTTAATYAGTTTINANAILQLGDGGATATSFLPDNYDVTVNGILQIAKGTNSETVGALNGSGVISNAGSGAGTTTTLIVGNNNNSGSYSGTLLNPTETLAFTKVGTGTQTLTGANTFIGLVSVSAGTLNANSATALGAASSTAGISVTSGATLSLGAALNYSSPGRTTTISGTGVGGTAGALIIARTGDVNVGSISLAGPTTIRGTVTGGRLTSAITGTQNLTLNIDTSVTTTLAGAISTSTGSLTKSGSGTLSLTNGTNAYSGGTTISAGTLSFSSGALGSSGSVSVSSAALQWLNANTQDLSARLVMPSIGGYSEIDVGANNVSFASAIGNSGSAALYKSGTGALTLTQASTYTGLTTVAAGTLRAGTVNALASSSQVAIGANTATLQTLTTGGQNGKLTVASLNNAAGGIIKIGG